jgi:short-subunit dehydrogenase
MRKQCEYAGIARRAKRQRRERVRTPAERTDDMPETRHGAKSGLRALSQAKASVVAGFMNNLVAFSNRLTPRSMQRATMKGILG